MMSSVIVPEELLVLPNLPEPGQNRLIILDHTEIPLGSIKDEVSQTQQVSQDEQELKCQFCDKPVKEEVYQFEVDDLDCYYLCTRCFDRGVRFCQYGQKFCLGEQLIQLDQGPVINKSHEEIISTYLKLPSWDKKRDYLEMCSLDSEITITKQWGTTCPPKPPPQGDNVSP